MKCPSDCQVALPEQPHPVPVDFFVSHKTRVLIITGPNTGGKTICLKTIGLAAMMAKSGLFNVTFSLSCKFLAFFLAHELELLHSMISCIELLHSMISFSLFNFIFP